MNVVTNMSDAHFSSDSDDHESENKTPYEPLKSIAIPKAIVISADTADDDKSEAQDHELKEIDDRLRAKLKIRADIDDLERELESSLNVSNSPKHTICTIEETENVQKYGLANYTGLNLLRGVVTGTTNAVIDGTTIVGSGIKTISETALDVTTGAIVGTANVAHETANAAIGATNLVVGTSVGAVIKTGELAQDAGTVMINTLKKPFKPEEVWVEYFSDDSEYDFDAYADDHNEPYSLTDSDIERVAREAICTDNRSYDNETASADVDADVIGKIEGNNPLFEFDESELMVSDEDP